MGDSLLSVVQAASINSEENQVPAEDSVPQERVVQQYDGVDCFRDVPIS